MSEATPCEWANNVTGCLGNLTTTTPDKEGTLPGPPAAVAADLVDEELRHVLIVVLIIGLQVPTVVVGIFTNLVNIVVFRMMGLNNSMSIAFLALSISDSGYVVVFFVIRVNSFLQHVACVHSRLRLTFFSFFLSFYGLFFQDVSVAVTVFIAVQKCSCVAIPHLFKDVFTPRRTVIVLACLSLSMTLNYVPLFAGMTFVEADYPPGSNATQIVLRLGPAYRDGMKFWRVFNKIVLPATAQSICVVCLVVMVAQLTRSARFRASQSNSNNLDSGCTSRDNNTTSPGSQEAQKTSVKLGYKERRAVSAVALVLVLSVVCTMPATALNFAQLIAPGFFQDTKHYTMLYLLNNSQNIFTHISASVNIFIYLKYNTKFRENAKVLFHWCCCGGRKNISREAEND